jgi:hypothetical protein
MNANRFSVWFISTSHLNCSQLLGAKEKERKYGEYSHHGREKESRRTITNISVSSFIDITSPAYLNTRIIERTNVFCVRADRRESFLDIIPCSPADRLCSLVVRVPGHRSTGPG